MKKNEKKKNNKRKKRRKHPTEKKWRPRQLDWNTPNLPCLTDVGEFMY